MAKAWDNLSVANGHVDWSAGIPTIVVDAAEESDNAANNQMSFGCTCTGADDVVTVQAGKVRHGIRTAISVAGDDITITDDQTWLWIEHVYGSGAATIESDTSEPQDDSTTHRRPLCLVSFADSIATIDDGNRFHVGDIFIPGVGG